ncbi:FMN-dependent dehydrogenase-domain-containing protein [Chytridium lagenaria]|nr:FMN-dependent dehydrogenase-domain-containing protein [Chytridium lagenaria]
MIIIVSLHTQRSPSDLWVILHDKVYDLSLFINEHPGGSKVLILLEAGRDGTSAFRTFHSKGHSRLSPSASACLGILDPSSKPSLLPSPPASTPSSPTTITAHQTGSKPPLSAMFNAFDFEAVASPWAYYSSGADDEITLRENHAAFHRIYMRPRVMVDVKVIIYLFYSPLLYNRQSIIHQHLYHHAPAHPVTLPIYISSCALGRLGHPDGRKGIIQLMPTLASCSMDEMMDAKVSPSQVQWFQLYAEARGVKALFVTVDAPQLGRREKDMRVKFIDTAPDVQSPSTVDRNAGAARAISSFIDPSLSWSTSPGSVPSPLSPSSSKASKPRKTPSSLSNHGCDGIVVSNHGVALEVLVEVVDALRNMDGRFEIYVDGGFRRGSDILKALALGAAGVGLGRPTLYAMSAYGDEGVERLIDLLRDEMVMNMRLLGTPDLGALKREMVMTENGLGSAVYEPLRPAGMGKSRL